MAEEHSAETQQPVHSDVRHAASLLESWRAVLGACNDWQWVSPALYEQDLPCAVLQQRRLLLSCPPDQLVELCLAAAAAAAADGGSRAPAKEAAEKAAGDSAGDPAAAAAAAAADGGSELTAAALARFLDCSNDLCAAAVEVVDLSVRHRLQQQGQGQGQEQELTVVAGTPGVSWLAQQWLWPGCGFIGPGGTAAGAAAVGALSGAVTDGIAVGADLMVAKKLLAAATGVDQLLKQAARH